LKPGDVVGFFATTYNGRWPIAYRRVRGVSGADVTLDGLLPYLMTGTVTMRKVPFNGKLALRNIDFDCSAVADGAENATGIIRMLSFAKREVTGCKFRNVDLDQAFTNYILYSDYCGDQLTEDNEVIEAIMGGSFCSSFRYNKDRIAYNDVDGDLFGFHGVNGGKSVRIGNKIRGRWPEDQVGSLSVRGFRDIGLAEPFYGWNTVYGMDSGIKFEDVWDAKAHANTFIRCNTCLNQSDQNPGSRSGGHQLTDNTGIDFYAYGIVIGTTDSADGDWRTVHFSGNKMGSSVATASEPYLFRGGSIAGGTNEVTDWPSGVAAFRTITNNGRLTKGPMGKLIYNPPDATGRRGIDIATTHVDVKIDHDKMVTTVSPRFYALPPRKDVAYGPIFMGAVDLASTADQALAIVLPDGFTRYRAVAAHMVNNSAANAAAAVGGIYTAASKGGDQLVANSQAYTALTGINTDQAMTIATSVANTTLTDLSLFLSLTTPSANAATGYLVIMGYWIP
jgi:hypothetical protein